MDRVPPEVLIHIFSKATWESLQHCRRVCKPWHAALSDPATLRSIKLPECLVLHINHKDNPSVTSPRFICLYDQTTVPSSDNAIFRISQASDPLSATTELVGSCNGLLCWCRKEPAGEKDLFAFTVFISNPMTGESMTIPVGTNHLRSSRYSWDSKFRIGFRYVPNTNQYKLVYSSDMITPGKYETSVLTLGNATSWKLLECPNYRVCPNFGVHVNGAVHWIGDEVVEPDNRYTGHKICSFDLETEQFRILPWPPCKTRYGFDGITVLGDWWLTAWCDHGQRIWMKMRYTSTWIEMKTRGLDKESVYQYHRRAYDVPLVVYPKSKKILVFQNQYHSQQLYVYNHKEVHNSYIDLSFPCIKEAITGFVPTFLSIKDVLNG